MSENVEDKWETVVIDGFFVTLKNGKRMASHSSIEPADVYRNAAMERARRRAEKRANQG